MRLSVSVRLRSRHADRIFAAMDTNRQNRHAESVDDEMVRWMKERRQARPERRTAGQPRADERRRVCAFCYQPGDHPTAAHCLRALERQ
jgi:hypothetical protein